MTSDPESSLFEFAASNRIATNEEEEIVTQLHTALGTSGVPLKLRRPPTMTPAPKWRSYTHVFIAAGLIIALATAGLFAIDHQSGTPSPTEVPEVVLGLADQENATPNEDGFASGDLPLAIGSQAPDFTLSTFSGEEVTLSDHRGEIVVINFWADWCVPCQSDASALQRFQDSSTADVTIISVGSHDSDPATSQKVAENLEITYPIGLDTESGAIADDYMVSQYPVTFIVNPQGIVDTVVVGAMSYAQLEQAVSSARISANENATTTTTTCDLSGDVPIFSAINESPIDEPAVLVTLDRELKLVCGNEETILATGVLMATPTNAAYVLQAISPEGTLFLNIATGESTYFPHNPDSSQLAITEQPPGPWMVLNSSGNPDTVSLLNLTTLEELPIQANTVQVGEEAISTMAVNSDGGTIVIALSSASNEGNRQVDGFFFANTNRESNYVVIDPVPEPRQAAVSPDGTKIAMTSHEESMSSGITTITMYSTENGEILNTWDVESGDRFIDLAWLNDGSALLFSNRSALYATAPDQNEPEVLLQGDEVLGLTLTRDDRVIAVRHVDSAGAGPNTPVTSIINLDTGDTVTLDGDDLWTGSTLASRRTTLVLTDGSAALPGDTHNLTIVDAVTGEEVGTLEYTIPAHRGFSHSSWGVDRDITVLAFSPDSMWQLVDEQGNATLVRINPPPIDADASEEAVMLQISSNGYLALRIFEPFSVWLLIPGESEWMEVSIANPEDSGGVQPSISFIPGSN